MVVGVVIAAEVVSVVIVSTVEVVVSSKCVLPMVVVVVLFALRMSFSFSPSCGDDSANDSGGDDDTSIDCTKHIDRHTEIRSNRCESDVTLLFEERVLPHLCRIHIGPYHIHIFFQKDVDRSVNERSMRRVDASRNNRNVAIGVRR